MDAEFVCQMEDVLDLYEEPWDEEEPTVCLDEKPYQLHDNTRDPLPAEPGEKITHTSEKEHAISLLCWLPRLVGVM